jgi:hypothetical protein
VVLIIAIAKFLWDAAQWFRPKTANQLPART